MFNCKPTNIWANFWNDWCRCFPWLTPWFVNTLIQWISSVKVALNFLFRLSVSHVGRMNTQFWLLNSLVRFAGWVNSELVASMRNTERMMFNSVHNAIWNVLPSVYFLSLPESQDGGMLLARITGIMLRNNSLCQNRKVARSQNVWK